MAKVEDLNLLTELSNMIVQENKKTEAINLSENEIDSKEDSISLTSSEKDKQNNIKNNKKQLSPIGVSFKLERLFNINISGLSCYIQGLLLITFPAKKSDYNNINPTNKEKFESIFNPLLHVKLINGNIDNVLKFRKFEIVESDELYENNRIGTFRFKKTKDLNVIIAVSYNVFGEFQQNYDLSSYPFDSQYINIRFKPKELNRYIITPILWNKSLKEGDYNENHEYSGMELNDNILSDYKLLDNELNCYKAFYGNDEVVFSVSILRQSMHIFIRYILITALTALCSLCTYTLPHDQDTADKYSITITLILTIVAFNFVISEQFPKMSYMTFLDQYFLFSFLFVGLNLICNAVIIADVDSFDDAWLGLAIGMLVLYVLLQVIFGVKACLLRKKEYDKFEKHSYELDTGKKKPIVLKTKDLFTSTRLKYKIATNINEKLLKDLK